MQVMFAIFQEIAIGIGYIIVGGDGRGIIGQMFLPGFHRFRIMLRQIISFALRERDGLHDGRIRAQELLGKIQIAQPLRVALGIDAHHPKAIGTPRMLHATDKKGQLEILIGTFKTVKL